MAENKRKTTARKRKTSAKDKVIVNKRGRKRQITDEEFWDAMEKNAGLYSMTAKYIRETLKMPFTRQAAAARGAKDLERVKEIKEGVKDIAEHTILIGMTKADIATRVKTAQWYLDRHAKDRGYGAPERNNSNNDNEIGFEPVKVMHVDASGNLVEIPL